MGSGVVVELKDKGRREIASGILGEEKPCLPRPIEMTQARRIGAVTICSLHLRPQAPRREMCMLSDGGCPILGGINKNVYFGENVNDCHVIVLPLRVYHTKIKEKKQHRGQMIFLLYPVKTFEVLGGERSNVTEYHYWLPRSAKPIPPLMGPRRDKSAKLAKTYNSRHSLVVTDPTTTQPVHSLSLGELTGTRVFCVLWS